MMIDVLFYLVVGVGIFIFLWAVYIFVKELIKEIKAEALLELLPKKEALNKYVKFKFDVIALLPKTDFEITFEI